MKQIAIIGGGITGLTTAIALNKLGISNAVYEQAAQLSAVGAGIWLQPNALRVLDYLGIGQAIRSNGIPLDKVDITNQNLKPFKTTDSKLLKDNQGNSIISIHRGNLQRILQEALPKDQLNLAYRYLSHQDGGQQVHVKFEKDEIETNLLLAADGIHSKVRKAIFPESKLRYSGQTCWRGVATISLPDELLNTGREAWGNGVRFGFSQLSATQVYWFAVAKSAPNLKDDLSSLLGNLLSKFSEFHPIVQAIIEATAADQIIRGNISDLNRLGSWHQGNCILLGDAAHASTPNMGQGAAQGIEDAFYISHLLAEHADTKEVFHHFERARREKVDYVVNNSWRFGQMAHHQMGSMLMKAMMKLTPISVMEKQMQKLYGVPTLGK